MIFFFHFIRTGEFQIIFMEHLQDFVLFRIYVEAYTQGWNADSDKLVAKCMWSGSVPIALTLPSVQNSIREELSF